MATRPRVYISGPLTGSGEQMQNVVNAIGVAQHLIKLGFAPLCPHLTHYIDPGNTLPHDVWMQVDKPWVRVADALVRIPGESKGADIECREAGEHNIPVFHDYECLVNHFRPRLAVFEPPALDVVVPDLILEPPACVIAPEQVPDRDGTVHFATGAVRSADVEGYRYDLISPIGMRRLAATCHEGAVKYDDFNWEKGMDVADLLKHAIGHVYQYLAGNRDEDHLAHAAWGLFGSMHSEELWPELNQGKLRGPGCKAPAKAVNT